MHAYVCVCVRVSLCTYVNSMCAADRMNERFGSVARVASQTSQKPEPTLKQQHTPTRNPTNVCGLIPGINCVCVFILVVGIIAPSQTLDMPHISRINCVRVCTYATTHPSHNFVSSCAATPHSLPNFPNALVDECKHQHNTHTHTLTLDKCVFPSIQCHHRRCYVLDDDDVDGDDGGDEQGNQ